MFSGLAQPREAPEANVIKLAWPLAGLSPSTSLRYAQGERGGGENMEKFPFVLSVAAAAAKSKHGLSLNLMPLPQRPAPPVKQEQTRCRSLVVRENAPFSQRFVFSRQAAPIYPQARGTRPTVRVYDIGG